jgi:DNA-binding CsgD family transcriptional regulator
MTRKAKNPIPAKSKPKRGRPRKQLSEESILELARIGCPTEETARILQCSADTLERNFAGILKRG